MPMPACPAKGVSLVLEQAGGAQCCRQTELWDGEPGVMRIQYMEGETSETNFKQVWGKNSSHIPSQAEELQPQSSKEKKSWAEIFFYT